MKIKVCGLRDRDNIHEVASLGPDFAGFIFYPGSPRYAGDTLIPGDLEGLPASTKKTGVFVNADMNGLTGIFRRYKLDYVQLHGNETSDYCRQLHLEGIPIIKAFQIRMNFDFSRLEDYLPFSDYFLFDTQTSAYGGSGKQFDWRILSDHNPGLPFFLSGGIGPADHDKILSFNHPSFAGIDLNSRFEREPGRKDVEKLGDFFKKLNINR